MGGFLCDCVFMSCVFLEVVLVPSVTLSHPFFNVTCLMTFESLGTSAAVQNPSLSPDAQNDPWSLGVFEKQWTMVRSYKGSGSCFIFFSMKWQRISALKGY